MKKHGAAAALFCILAQICCCCGCTDGQRGMEKAASERHFQEERYTWALDEGMQITEETILIEGLTKKYTFLFLTDVHLVVEDETLSEQEQEYAEQRYPMFRNGEGTASVDQFPKWITYANQVNLDGVLLGGDIIDAPTKASADWLQGQLSKLRMPYLYVPGNHDWTFPWEYMTETGRQNYLPMLETFTQGTTEINTLDFGELVVAGINDSTNQVSSEALPEFERLYGEGRPMIVMAHVPFLTQSALARSVEVWNSVLVLGGAGDGYLQPNEYSAAFLNMLTAAESPVELVLAGHVHFYDKDVIEGEKNVLQLIGGAGYEGNAILLHIMGGSKNLSR